MIYLNIIPLVLKVIYLVLNIIFVVLNILLLVLNVIRLLVERLSVIPPKELRFLIKGKNLAQGMRLENLLKKNYIIKEVENG